MINPYADRPVYIQLADLLRAQITSGQLRVGAYLASEKRLAQEHEVGRDTVRSAIAVLRAEGLVETRRPGGTRVRSTERADVVLELGSSVAYRVATFDERMVLGLPAGAHVAEVIDAEGESRIYLADRYIFRSM